MRWERLFAEIEGSIGDDELAERDALVEDLVDEQWAQTSWRDLLGGQVEVDVRGVGMVRGQARAVSSEIVHIASGAFDYVIATHAVRAVVSAQERAVPTGAVQRTLSWVLACRAIARAGTEVTVVLDDASRRTGYIEQVGRDFVRLALASGATVDIAISACVMVVASTP
jgi:hypothetical protein